MIFQNYCFRSVVLEELLHFFDRVHFFVRQNRTTAPIDEGRRGFKESKTESARCYINRENTLRFFRLRSRHVLSAKAQGVLAIDVTSREHPALFQIAKSSCVICAQSEKAQ